MDKNSLTGLILIGLLLCGFMLCDRPGSKDKDATKDTEKTAQAAPAKEQPAVADLSGAADGIASSVRTLGTPEADGSRSLTVGNTALTLDSAGHIDGTVLLDGKAFSVADVLSGNGSLTPELRAEAVKAIKSDLAKAGRFGSFAAFTGGAEETVTVAAGKMAVTFSSRGGRISSVVLPGYKTETTTPATDICLFDSSTGGYEFELETANQRISTADLNFRMTQPNDTTVVMTLPLAEGTQFGMRYTVHPADFLVTVDILQKGMDNIVPLNRSSMRLRWNQRLRRNEKGRAFEERNSAIYYKFANESPDDMSANSDDDEQLTGNLKWVGFKNQFFSSVIIAKDHFETADLDSKIDKAGNFLKDMSMDATVSYSSAKDNPASFVFYFGPNDYPLLSDLDERIEKTGFSKDADLQLNKLIPLGWGIFGWINRYCVIPVFTFLGGFISNYGLIIIILTLLVKLVLFPFTYKSYMSQAKMRVLAPEIKEINDKYPGQENAMKRQQETMALYSKSGASPFSGCLPMLLQMPVLIAMFSFFPSAIELRGESFLWAHDLSAPDYIFSLPFSIPFLGNQLSLFCLLMTVVNIIYTYINMQNQPTSSSMPGMKWMMYLMPLFFLFFFNDYASGLSLYYFVFLLVTILQTFAFRLFTNQDKLRAEMKENAKKPRKKSGWMARLQEAQKKQEAMMREQRRREEKRRR